MPAPVRLREDFSADEPRETLKTAQDTEQLLGECEVAFLATLAAFDPNHHAVAVDIDTCGPAA